MYATMYYMLLPNVPGTRESLFQSIFDHPVESSSICIELIGYTKPLICVIVNYLNPVLLHWSGICVVTMPDRGTEWLAAKGSAP